MKSPGIPPAIRKSASLAPWLSPDESSAAARRTPPWPHSNGVEGKTNGIMVICYGSMSYMLWFYCYGHFYVSCCFMVILWLFRSHAELHPIVPDCLC